MSAKGLILFSNHMEDAEAIFTRDLLIRSGIEIHSFSFESLEVQTSYGLKVKADYLYNQITDFSIYDFIVIPGGKYVSEKPSFTPELQKLLVDFHKRQKVLCLICAAPLFLKNTKILTPSSNYTCYGDLHQQINEGNYIDTSVVRCLRLITAKSAGYILEFSTEIINSILSIQESNQVKKQLLLKN
jgi:4-methyl-5(b-hydroxyethyl)-thiazole monophosphate biosynthesis